MRGYFFCVIVDHCFFRKNSIRSIPIGTRFWGWASEGLEVFGLAAFSFVEDVKSVGVYDSRV